MLPMTLWGACPRGPGPKTGTGNRLRDIRGAPLLMPLLPCQDPEASQMEFSWSVSAHGPRKALC